MKPSTGKPNTGTSRNDFVAPWWLSAALAIRASLMLRFSALHAYRRVRDPALSWPLTMHTISFARDPGCWNPSGYKFRKLAGSVSEAIRGSTVRARLVKKERQCFGIRRGRDADDTSALTRQLLLGSGDLIEIET